MGTALKFPFMNLESLNLEVSKQEAEGTCRSAASGSRSEMQQGCGKQLNEECVVQMSLGGDKNM